MNRIPYSLCIAPAGLTNGDHWLPKYGEGSVAQINKSRRIPCDSYQRIMGCSSRNGPCERPGGGSHIAVERVPARAVVCAIVAGKSIGIPAICTPPDIFSFSRNKGFVSKRVFYGDRGIDHFVNDDIMLRPCRNAPAIDMNRNISCGGII